MLQTVIDSKKGGATIAAMCLAVAFAEASCSTAAGREDGPHRGTLYESMADGKLWLVENLSIPVADSYCYDDRESNCDLFGRLYTWQAAQQACLQVGDGSRLPTDDEWRTLARSFGGIYDDAKDRGSEAYHALLRGGRSGFAAILGGGRSVDGRYDDLDGSTALYRQLDGEKNLALAVRCLRDG